MASLHDLLGKLCCHFNKTSRTYNLPKLRSKLYGVLLHFSDIPNTCTRSTTGFSLNELDMLYAEIHCMANFREFDRACGLHQLLAQLMDDNGQISDEILLCLRFFLCLARWRSTSSTPLGGPWQLPILDLKDTSISLFDPKQLTSYGDTKVYRTSFYYTHYPNEIFESVSVPPLKEAAEFNHRIFEATPGFDERGNPLYRSTGTFSQKCESVIEKPTSFTMFGSVSTNRPIDDFTLQIPVLTPFMAQNPMPFTLGSHFDYSVHRKQCSTDEGFVDSDNNAVATTPDPGEIWSKVCKLKRLPRRSWDYHNKLVGSKPPVYYSQAGPAAGQVIYQGIQRQLRLIDPGLADNQEGCCTSTCVQTFDQLIQDVLHLLLGVSSKTLFYDKQKHLFRLRTKLAIPLISPEPLSLALKDFLDCGTLYLKLELFSQPQALGSYLTNGIVVECLKEGVAQYLQHYRGCILYIKETQSNTIFSLHQAVYRAYRQLRYLSDLCLGERHLLSRLGQECVLPKGLRLLTYLFQSVLQEWGGENDFLLLFLLKTACTPYFRFLHDWVFEGTLNDPYNEFNIQVNENCLNNQNCRSLFWSHGYVLKERMSSVPFLGEDMTRTILLCGKSLNLLKICDPKHSLLDSRHRRPILGLALTSSELEKCLEESNNYYNSLNTLLFKSKEPLYSRGASLAAQKKKNRSSVVLTESASTKKTSAVPMTVLPSQSASIEDASNANIVIRQEESQTNKKTVYDEYEEAAKQEVTEHYNQLIKEAENTREKILWKVKRLELHEKRSALVENDLLLTDIDQNSVDICNNNNNVIINNNNSEDLSEETALRQDASITADIENGNNNDLVNTEVITMDIPDPPLEDSETSASSPETLPLATVPMCEDDSDIIGNSELPEDNEKDGIDLELQPVLACDSEDDGLVADVTQEDNEESGPGDEKKEIDFDSILNITVPKVQPYQSEYSSLRPGALPLQDILVSLNVFGPTPDWDEEQEIDYLSVPLPVFFQRSFNPPLQAQMRLVNQSVLHHFKHNLHLDEHLNILRNIFLFNDGEFGRTISHLIYTKASSLAKFQDLQNPFTLRTILNTALSSCHSGDNPFSENLCLGPRIGCNTDPAPGFAALMNLELKYKVEWPLDIVISEQSEELYNHLFVFLLQINHVIWTLTDAWYRLKHYDQMYHLSGHWQFRQIQVFRHEMLHFAQSVYEFVSRQILQQSWAEFQTELQEKAEDLDELSNAHMNYLRKACARCMLGSSVDPTLQKSISVAFQTCLLFHKQLVMLPWEQGLPLNQQAFSKLNATYQYFKNYLKLLCKGLRSKVSGRPYHHFSYLVLLLDPPG